MITVSQTMSHYVKLETLTDNQKGQIDEDLRVKDVQIKGRRKIVNEYQFYELTDDDQYCIIPFAYGCSKVDVKRRKRSAFPPCTVSFEAAPRPEQKVVLKEALSHMNKTGSTMVCAYPGFGKTCCSLYLTSKTNLKTLVIVNKLVLVQQWKESILKFCPKATVQFVETKTKLDTTHDFYIMNAQNIEKKGVEYFDHIGTVIVDEAHLIMAKTLSRSLQYLRPRYLIGLTATPYRPDGLNCLLPLYFGEHKIIRELKREHIVHPIYTQFVPTVRHNNDGTLNWNAVLDSQAEDEDRNNMIVNLVCEYNDRNILIIVKRVSQGEWLQSALTERGESVTSLLGTNQEYDKGARVLIGTGQKVGTGFDHAKLNMLLLAADIEEYFIQYLGRDLSNEDTLPIVLDLVDENPTLKRHFATRRRTYKKHGGKIIERS